MALYPDQLEAAAREYCRLAGLDPDESVSHSPEPNDNGVVLDVLMYSPRWKRVARRIEDFELMLLAVEHGRKL